MYYTDDVIEQSTEQKLLLHLLPLFLLLAMASMLNRLSLGYAGQAMGDDVGISGGQLSLAESLFGLGFMVASVPAAWLLWRLGARIWITAMALATGLAALAHAAIPDAESLYAVHLALGVAEAGLLPAIIFYLSLLMPERHRAKAIAGVIAGVALVPIISGTGSDFLLLLGKWFGVSNWQFLFVLEGLPTLWFALFVPGRTPMTPAEARWLPPSERIWLEEQLSLSVPPGPPPGFVDGLRSTQTWKLAAIQGIVGVVGGNLGVWVPLAMQEKSYVAPVTAAGMMIGASVLGVLLTVAAAVVFHNPTQWRRTLTLCLGVAGICMVAAAVLPSGFIDVVMVAGVGVLTPVALGLSWVMAPCLLTGAAAASGFAIVSMAGMLGYYAAGGLAAVGLDTGVRCFVLAVACFVAAWLARGLDAGRRAKLATSPASPASS